MRNRCRGGRQIEIKGNDLRSKVWEPEYKKNWIQKKAGKACKGSSWQSHTAVPTSGEINSEDCTKTGVLNLGWHLPIAVAFRAGAQR